MGLSSVPPLDIVSSLARIRLNILELERYCDYDSHDHFNFNCS